MKDISDPNPWDEERMASSEATRSALTFDKTPVSGITPNSAVDATRTKST